MQQNRAVEAKDSNRRFGDFTGLASNYSRFRPAYSPQAVNALLQLIPKAKNEVDVADLGAGTGLWTRMMASAGVRSVHAVEPNADMRKHGEADSRGFPIVWHEGSGEVTGLPSSSFDLVTAASCFHWFDFEKGTEEISRLLRPGGRFVALWNPRFIDNNPMLVEIEAKIKELAPHVRRVSSGQSDFTSTLFEKLEQSPRFKDTIYLEGRHVQKMTPEQYMGAWKSVNDLQVQMGAAAFAKFLEFVEQKTARLEFIDAVYKTRCWTAVKAD